MFLKRIYELACPYLVNKKIKEVRIGLKMLGVELSDKSLGVAYVLEDKFGRCCEALPEAGKLDGMSAIDMAAWVLKENDGIKKNLGLAVLNAVAHYQGIHDLKNVDAALAVNIRKNETIGLIGYIEPLARFIRSKDCHLIAFDRAQQNKYNLYPESEQELRLPTCDVVFITGTTLINGTLENILNYCTRAREIVIVGASTPLYPMAFHDTRITYLSGMKWPADHKTITLSLISQAAGLKQLTPYGVKISLSVRK